jgi:hypothetical protein
MTESTPTRICERYYVTATITEELIADATFDALAYLREMLRRNLQGGAEKFGYSLVYGYTPDMRRVMPSEMTQHEREHMVYMRMRKYRMVGRVFPRRIVDIDRACRSIDDIKNNKNGFDPLLDFLGIMDWVSELHRLVHNEEPTDLWSMREKSTPGRYAVPEARQ